MASNFEYELVTILAVPYLLAGMGTKIDYAINLLRSSSNSNSFTVNGVDDLNYYLNSSGLKVKPRRSGLEDKGQSSIDKMFDRNNADSIRRTMQMHEDVFKYQVTNTYLLENCMLKINVQKFSYKFRGKQVHVRYLLHAKY